jgi:hypothetical protein
MEKNMALKGTMLLNDDACLTLHMFNTARNFQYILAHSEACNSTYENGVVKKIRISTSLENTGFYDVERTGGWLVGVDQALEPEPVLYRGRIWPL